MLKQPMFELHILHSQGMWHAQMLSVIWGHALQVDNVTFERQPIADHANQLAANVQGNLKRSLEALGVVRSQYFNTNCCSVAAFTT